MKQVDNKSVQMKFAAILTVICLSVFSGGNVFAASCEQKAASMAAAQKARVLSVRASGKSCKIKLLIKSAKGAPKRKTVVVSK